MQISIKLHCQRIVRWNNNQLLFKSVEALLFEQLLVTY